MTRMLLAGSVAVAMAAGLAAQAPRGGATPDRGLRMEITVPPSVRSEPVTGELAKHASIAAFVGTPHMAR